MTMQEKIDQLRARLAYVLGSDAAGLEVTLAGDALELRATTDFCARFLWFRSADVLGAFLRELGVQVVLSSTV